MFSVAHRAYCVSFVSIFDFCLIGQFLRHLFFFGGGDFIGPFVIKSTVSKDWRAFRLQFLWSKLLMAQTCWQIYWY